MSVRSVVRPKQPRNFKLTALVIVVMMLVYLVSSYLRPWSPKKGLGLIFGILATLLFVFEMAYPFRRPNAWLLGTAKAWVQAHIYLGVVAFVAVLMHSGFGWPRGMMGLALWILSFWATAS